MSLTTKDKQDIKSMLDTSIKAGIAHLPTVEAVRYIVKAEIAPLDMRVSRLETSTKSEISKLGTLIEDNKSETFRLGVLIEYMDSRLQSVAETVGNHLKLSSKVDKHEFRLQDIESIQPMIIETLKMHSKKLNTI